MSVLVEELLKLAQPRTTSELLSTDPETMDPLNPKHREFLERRQAALERVQVAKPRPEDVPIKKKLFRQMLGEGLMAAGVIGAGTGLGYGVRGLLTKKVPKSILLRYPVLIPATAAGTAALALYGNVKRQQIQERRLQRARTILNSHS